MNIKIDEELIKHGWDEDVWFHADKLSSAHIYLRLREGASWEDIPEDLLTDLAQLTKANSIEGMASPNPLPFLYEENMYTNYFIYILKEKATNPGKATKRITSP